MISSTTMNSWDRAGVIVSAVCLFHCLLLPFAFLALPAIAHLEAESEWLHVLFASLAMPVASFALSRGFSKHRSLTPLFLASLGIMLLWVALLLHDPAWLEKTVVSAGAALLGGAHLINHRMSCRCCKES